MLPGAVDVGMSRVATAARVPIDPLQPVLSTVTSDKVLQIIRDWDVLGLNRTQEVLHDRISIVTEADLDRSFETMNVTVLTSSLVRLMLLHQRDELLRSPALHLEVIIVGGRSTSVHLSVVSLLYLTRSHGISHHEVDAAAASQDMSAWDDCATSSKPLGWTRIVERSRLAIQLHVPGIDARPEHPWVVEIALSSFDEHHLEVVIQIGQAACNYTPVHRQ
jgi:hypothetical protein